MCPETSAAASWSGEAESIGIVPELSRDFTLYGCAYQETVCSHQQKLKLVRNFPLKYILQ